MQDSKIFPLFSPRHQDPMASIKTSKISLLISLLLVNVGCKVLSGDEILRLQSLGQISGAWWRRIQLDTKSSTNPISSVDPSEFTKTTEVTTLFFTGKGNLNARARSARLRLTRTNSKSGVGSSWITRVWSCQQTHTNKVTKPTTTIADWLNKREEDRWPNPLPPRVMIEHIADLDVHPPIWTNQHIACPSIHHLCPNSLIH